MRIIRNEEGGALPSEELNEPITSDTYAMGWVITAIKHMMLRGEVSKTSIPLVRIWEIMHGYSSEQVEDFTQNINDYIDWENVEWSPQNYLLRKEMEDTFVHLRKPESISIPKTLKQPETLEERYGFLLGIITAVIATGEMRVDGLAMQTLVWGLEGNTAIESECELLDIAKIYKSNYPEHPIVM